MSSNQELPEQQYQVVVNDEEQYSIWPEGRELPAGWRVAGKSGAKAECLEHIEKTWTDMRPRSLREQMDSGSVDEPKPVASRPAGEPLVDKLSKGGHPIVVTGAASQGASRFREDINAGHIRVRFTETAGGTELALRFDPNAIDLSRGDLETGTGRLRLSSELKLDGAHVKCVVEIDIAELNGNGRLEPIPAS